MIEHNKNKLIFVEIYGGFNIYLLHRSLLDGRLVWIVEDEETHYRTEYVGYTLKEIRDLIDYHINLSGIDDVLEIVKKRGYDVVFSDGKVMIDLEKRASDKQHDNHK